MLSDSSSTPTPPPLTIRKFLRYTLGNAGRMMLLWLVFGIAVGVLITPAPGGAGVMTAHALAGMIVLSPVGAFLGLAGARRRDALVMGLAGLAVGLGVGLALDGVSLSYAACVGLIMGGVIGTTFVAFFYRLPRLALRFLVARTQA